MNGSINFDGTLSGSIAGGGGGGGSEVTITPVLTEGTKIADYTIDSASGSLYAPEAGDTVDVTPNLNVGDKVADIEVNGVNKALYSQSYSYANDVHDTNSETIGGLQKGSNITPIMVKAVSYADRSGVDGETIGVLSVGDTDYNIKQKNANVINYSTTEQDTGVDWIDGNRIFRRVLIVNNLQADSNSDPLIEGIDYFYCAGLTTYSGDRASSPSAISMYNYQGVGTYYANVYKDSDNALHIANLSRQNTVSVIAIVYYTKVVVE